MSSRAMSSRSLRSSQQGLLLVPFSRTSTKQIRAFSVVGPSTWNGLPSEVYVEFGAHNSATFISANTTRRRQSQRLFKSAPSNTAITHVGDLHFSEHNSPLPNTAPIEIV